MTNENAPEGWWDRLNDHWNQTIQTASITYAEALVAVESTSEPEMRKHLDTSKQMLDYTVGGVEHYEKYMSERPKPVPPLDATDNRLEFMLELMLHIRRSAVDAYDVAQRKHLETVEAGKK